MLPKINLQSPIIVYTSQPLHMPAISIPLLPATHAVRRITKLEAQELVDRFQPRLRDYRLTVCFNN